MLALNRDNDNRPLGGYLRFFSTQLFISASMIQMLVSDMTVVGHTERHLAAADCKA
jgi:hypothetical protein